jgi:long-chain fatty acid transport protein
MFAKRLAVLIGAACTSMSVSATNGMNMEGYGPIALGMGGASMAYDVGNAAMINNPATLGLVAPGTSRLALFVGGLGPDVVANGRDSSATSFVMPAAGYVNRGERFTWGLGMMAQGGMGAEYSNGGFWGTLFSTPGANVNMAEGVARRNLSEVGVGRVLLPLAYQVSDTFNIGGSIDFVWAGMDIQWLVDGAHFADMMPANVPGTTRTFGAVSGSMVDRFAGMMGPGGIQGIGWGYFDFNKDGQFYQNATGTGWAGNIGFTWKATPNLTFGGVYHAKTNLDDLKTGGGGATVSFNVDMAGAPMTIPVKGEITIKNFQWPETYGIGLAWQASERWLLAADYKRINWSDVMSQFRMVFNASAGQAGLAAGFSGTQLRLDYEQQWEDQNAVMIGAAYKASDATTLRFGGNFANNPVPDRYLSPLFPAIIKNHLTFGIDHALDKSSVLHGALSYAPKVSATNQWGTALGLPATANQSVSHEQINWQLAWGYRF